MQLANPNYDISKLEELALKSKNQEIFSFLDSIKDMPCVDYHGGYKLLKIICYTKNLELLFYLIENNIPSLQVFSRRLDVFSYIFSEKYKDGINYIAKKITSPHLFLIIEVLNYCLPLEEDILKNIDLNYDFIANPEGLIKVLLEYYHTDEVKKNRDIIQNSPVKDKIIYQSSYQIYNNAVLESITSGGSTFTIEEFKAFRAKQKLTLSKSDKTAKLLWAKYHGISV